MEQQLLKSKYKAGEKIGESPFSVTYLGTTLNQNQPVVIKIYKRGTLNASLIQAMKSKVKLLTQIDHPHVARVLDGDYGWQGFYFVREYIPGVPLKQLQQIRKTAFDHQEVRQLGLAVCGALQAVHKQGLVHGALNLNNIIVKNDNSAALTDFTVEGEIKESLPQKAQYIMEYADTLSPEEILGGPAQRSSDIYSLAYALYRLLQKKEEAPADLRLALKKIRGEFAPLPGVPKYLNDILLKALNPDPLLRLPNILQLQESLQHQSLLSKKEEPELPVIELQNNAQNAEAEAAADQILVIKKERKRSLFLLKLLFLAILAGLIYSLVNSYFLNLK